MDPGGIAQQSRNQKQVCRRETVFPHHTASMWPHTGSMVILAVLAHRAILPVCGAHTASMEFSILPRNQMSKKQHHRHNLSRLVARVTLYNTPCSQ